MTNDDNENSFIQKHSKNYDNEKSTQEGKKIMVAQFVNSKVCKL
jgi:hypothetical protein